MPGFEVYRGGEPATKIGEASSEEAAVAIAVGFYIARQAEGIQYEMQIQVIDTSLGESGAVVAYIGGEALNLP